MKIDRSAELMRALRLPGAVVNGVSVNTVEGTARSSHKGACIGFETGAASLTGDPSREGGSRVYVKIRRNRGDVKFLPVTDESGNLIGVEIAACGDDAGIALTAALGEIVENLNQDLCQDM